jgi:soluble lytic murein transglycosylase-like protein
VLRAGHLVALRSPAGAVGILQVSVRVWRGFYDARALERDLAYNARAGAEILVHYLVDYAIPANEPGKEDSLDALARATYAAYNGGPRALGRWRNAKTRADLRDIDRAFWRDYQAVKPRALTVQACYSA